MKTALIGYTGFVGGNILNQAEITDCYNSSNIDEIEGREYDLVISAGARAEKWRINQEPENDLAEINGLIGHLRNVKTDKFVLISTVDVYAVPVAVDEDSEVQEEGLHAYGKNRYHLEKFCSDNFDTLTVRLPGLFGNGLKKNVIFDLLNNNNVDKIHHAGSFQYYNLANIWRDISTALRADIGLINFATEPVLTSEIAKHCFGLDFDNEPEGTTPGTYDMWTKHADLYGKTGKYMYEKQEVLDDIRQFIESQSGKI